MRAIEWCAVITACVLSVLVMVSFRGVVPANDLDFGWQYGVAIAEARGIPFGQSLVFTFGPLSFLYSQLALPEQRVLYLSLASALTIAFCLATVSATRPNWRWAIIALPLSLANRVVPDAFFFVLPLPLVLIAVSRWKSKRVQGAALVAFAGVLGILPLIKGSMTVSVAICVGLAAFTMAFRGQRIFATATVLTPLAIMGLCWVALGQPLSALPLYFGRQSYIVDGYTDAMSLWGPAWQVHAFLCCATVLTLSTMVAFRRWNAVVPLATACILFVAFKAGFVRHDGHVMIAAGVLPLVALLLVLARPTVRSGGALAICIGGWALVFGAYVPIDLSSDVARLIGDVQQSSRAIFEMVDDPGAYGVRFHRATEDIARSVDLPPTAGNADLYAAEQVALLASDRSYDPRPVLQSYSAYTPELERLNADHLIGPSAPESVFFEITPSDEHYPSLEDGASWPALLSLYSFRQFAGNFAVLDRSAASPSVRFDPPAVDRMFTYDEEVFVPPGALIWADIKIKPTAIGRIISKLWKLPKLTIDLTYEDGSHRTYRIIAGMAAAGFLLSPTVVGAHDFIGLQDQGTPAAPSTIVRSFRLHQDGGSWGKTFGVRLAQMHLPQTEGAAYQAMAQPGTDPKALAVGGDCSTDMVGDSVNRGENIISDARYIRVNGWGYAIAAKGIPSSGLRVAVRDADGRVRYAEAVRTPRHDVDAYLHLSSLMTSGFGTTLDLDGLKGPFDLSIVQDTPDGERLCPAAPVRVSRSHP